MAVASVPSSEAPVVREPRGQLLKRTLIVWLGVFTLSTVWSLSTPLWGAPDAPQHEMYAYSLVHGHLYPERSSQRIGTGNSGALTPVPAGILGSANTLACWAFQPKASASCIQPPTNDPTTVNYLNAAGRYLPAYYLVAGLPSLIVDQEHALWAMRLLPALMASLFIAWAVTAAMTYRRRAVAVCGVLIAVSPMVAYLSGVLNPNSLEITTAIAMCACSLVFVREPGSRLGYIMFRRAMIAAFALSLLRLLSPVWVAVWFLAFAAIASRDVWVQFFRWKNLKWAILALAGCALSVVWMRISGLTDFQLKPQFHYSLFERLNLSQQFIDKIIWPQEIGTFGWGDAPLKEGTINVYLFTSLFMIIVAWITLKPRKALVVAGLAAVQYLLPVVLHALQWNDNGAIWQGRYSLPLTVLVPITCLFLSAEGSKREPVEDSAVFRHMGWAYPIGAALLCYVHLNGFLLFMRRDVNGLPSKDTFDGPWQPPVPGRVLFGILILLAVITVASIAWLSWQDTGRPRFWWIRSASADTSVERPVIAAEPGGSEAGISPPQREVVDASEDASDAYLESDEEFSDTEPTSPKSLLPAVDPIA